MRIFILCILCLLVLVELARDDPKYDRLYRKGATLKLNQQQFWFKQVLDHYNYDAKKIHQWNQRYFAVTDYFNPKSGPVLLFICGEWRCDGVPESRNWIGVLAQRLQGLILVLEHRFYGDSLPFLQESFNIKNLEYLNSEQALRDIAHFIESMKQDKKFGINNNPWITVGGSYPGALSAWFRYKYPHLAIGAIASSAVVRAIEDFHDFDEQIYTSSVRSSSACADALNASTHKVESLLNKSTLEAHKFKIQFVGGQRLSNKEFMFFWADTIVLTIQYGGRTEICDKLKDQSQDNQFKILIENARTYPTYQYGSYYLKNQTFAVQTGSMARAWYYQYCTEYGWFQTYSQKHPMRSFQLNLDFFSEFCGDSFGHGTYPKCQRKNTEYGALMAQSSKILFANGIQDPWRWASLQETDSPDLIARVIDCDNCAHCVDLYTPESSDPVPLKKARDQQFLTLQDWIDEYWRQLNRQTFESILKNQI